MTLDQHVEKLQAVIKEVAQLPNFIPSEHVNQVFSELVELVVADSLWPHALSNVPFSKIRDLYGDQVRTHASNAETQMELYWAKRICESDDPVSELRQFPYLDNYRELVSRELGLMTDSGAELCTGDNVLIIGTGPLPMTAFAIHAQSGAHVDQVDSSYDAIEMCELISNKLGLETECFHGFGQDVDLTKKYSMILVAGLAGSTLEEKQEIIDHISPHVKDHGRILMRGAKGLRELLYPTFEPESIGGAELVKTYHPDDHVINSVFVYDPCSHTQDMIPEHTTTVPALAF